jgi:hypothetical protein
MTMERVGENGTRKAQAGTPIPRWRERMDALTDEQFTIIRHLTPAMASVLKCAPAEMSYCGYVAAARALALRGLVQVRRSADRTHHIALTEFGHEVRAIIPLGNSRSDFKKWCTREAKRRAVRAEPRSLAMP